MSINFKSLGKFFTIGLILLLPSLSLAAAGWNSKFDGTGYTVTTLNPKSPVPPGGAVSTAKIAYFVFASGDGNVISNTLDTSLCARIDDELKTNGATALLNVYTKDNGAGATNSSVTNYTPIKAYDPVSGSYITSLDGQTDGQIGQRNFQTTGIVVNGTCSNQCVFVVECVQ